MNRAYYKLWYRLENKDSYLIWYTNDVDGVFVDSHKRVPVFYSEADLERYAVKHQLAIVDEQLILHDLDGIILWLQQSDQVDPDCYNTLAVWNMFDDLFRALSKKFELKSAMEYQVYSKLVYGNNLPGFTPEGVHYEPAWSDREIKVISQRLELGLHQFRVSMNPQE